MRSPPFDGLSALLSALNGETSVPVPAPETVLSTNHVQGAPIENVVVAVSVPSLTVTVITAVPDASATGVTTSVREPHVPPNATPAVATTVGAALEAESVSAHGSPSGSVTVNMSAELAVSSSVVTS